jgi:hypothetical protein
VNGVEEDGRGRQRDLEREPAGHLGHEPGLPRGRRVDLLQRLDDLVDRQFDLHAAVVVERDRLAGPHPRYGVVEGVQEHPPAELSVGDHVEAEIDLPPHDLADRLVLELAKRRPILLALLGLDRRVPFRVELIDRTA